MSLSQLLPTPHPPPLLVPADPSPCPLPLPHATWGIEDARRALDLARPQLAVALPEAEAVSALTTVVLRVGDHAVKVYPPGTDADHLATLVRALHGSATSLQPVGLPVGTPSGVVTVQPWVADCGPVDWSGLGTVLRAFHDEHARASVPDWQPLTRVVSQAALLPAEAAQVLLRARSQLLDALGSASSELGTGVIHGDVSLSNVIRTTTGPRLIDLDWVASGPLEYDLSGAARRFRSGEITATEYDAFCAGYGYDVLTWPGLSTLDRIAELSAVAFRIWDCSRQSVGLDWLDEELRRWRWR